MINTKEWCLAAKDQQWKHKQHALQWSFVFGKLCFWQFRMHWLLLDRQHALPTDDPMVQIGSPRERCGQHGEVVVLPKRNGCSDQETLCTCHFSQAVRCLEQPNMAEPSWSCHWSPDNSNHSMLANIRTNNQEWWDLIILAHISNHHNPFWTTIIDHDWPPSA